MKINKSDFLGKLEKIFKSKKTKNQINNKNTIITNKPNRVIFVNNKYYSSSNQNDTPIKTIINRINVNNIIKRINSRGKKTNIFKNRIIKDNNVNNFKINNNYSDIIKYNDNTLENNFSYVRSTIFQKYQNVNSSNNKIKNNNYMDDNLRLNTHNLSPIYYNNNYNYNRINDNIVNNNNIYKKTFNNFYNRKNILLKNSNSMKNYNGNATNLYPEYLYRNESNISKREAINNNMTINIDSIQNNYIHNKNNEFVNNYFTINNNNNK